MSNTASNYNVQRLQIGIGLATLALIATAPATLFRAKVTGSWVSLLTILYGIMMFASSYVEEEHHFWYWACSGWLAWLFLKQ